jgi:hypothetical protein
MRFNHYGFRRRFPSAGGFMKKFLATVALLTLCSGAPRTLEAAIVFSDSFNTDGALVGSTPSVGGAWASTSGAGTNNLTVVGTALPVLTSGQDAQAAFSSVITRVDGQSAYMGLNINVSAAQATGDYFAALNVTGTALFNRLHIRSSGAGYQLGIASTSGGAPVTYGTAELSFGTSVNVVTAWDFVAGATNDEFAIYVNPLDSVRANNTAYLSGYVWGSTTAEPASFGFAGVRQGSAAAAPTLVMDNLVVATQFSDIVTAVPEPASIACLMVAGAVGGLVRYRRRKVVA